MASRAPSSDSFKIGPLTHYAEVGELRAWFSGAAVGDVATYATGPFASPAHPACALVREWYAADEAELFRTPSKARANCGDYQVRKLCPPTAPMAEATKLEAGCSLSSSPLLEERKALPQDALRVLDALRAAAEGGRACPTYTALARSLGLKKARARYMFRLLVEAGRVIEIEPGQPHRTRPVPRVIEIAGGARTRKQPIGERA